MDWRHGDAGGHLGPPSSRGRFHRFYIMKCAEGCGPSTLRGKLGLVLARRAWSLSLDCVLQRRLATSVTVALLRSPLGIDDVFLYHIRSCTPLNGRELGTGPAAAIGWPRFA